MVQLGANGRVDLLGLANGIRVKGRALNSEIGDFISSVASIRAQVTTAVSLGGREADCAVLCCACWVYRGCRSVRISYRTTHDSMTALQPHPPPLPQTLSFGARR